MTERQRSGELVWQRAAGRGHFHQGVSESRFFGLGRLTNVHYRDFATDVTSQFEGRSKDEEDGRCDGFVCAARASTDLD